MAWPALAVHRFAWPGPGHARQSAAASESL